MKKIFVLCTLLIFAISVSAQSGQTIIKQTVSKTLTSAYNSIGKDSVTFEIQSLRDVSIIVKPTLGAGCDSIYTTIKGYVSNDDSGVAWAPLQSNPDYSTKMFDTLRTVNGTTANNAWVLAKTSLSNVKVKFIIKNIDNTNEDNVFKFYFVAKPAYTFSR